MRGIERLVQLRSSGLKPQVVHLDMPGMGLSSGSVMEGQVLVEEGDSLTSPELQILRGLCVIAMGLSGDIKRTEEWARTAIRFGAKDVGIAVLCKDGSTDGPVWICRNGEVLA